MRWFDMFLTVSVLMAESPVPTLPISTEVLPLSETTISPGLTMGALTERYRVSSALEGGGE